MKLCFFTLVALLFAFTQALAGQISGTIRSGNAPLSGATVIIQCGRASGSGTTDGNGRYSVFVNAAGRCTLSLPRHGNVSAQVFSSNQPTRHDFVFDGSRLIRR